MSDEATRVQHEVNKKVTDTLLYVLSFTTAFMFIRVIYEMFKHVTGNKKGLLPLVVFTVVIGVATVVLTYFLINRLKKNEFAIDEDMAMKDKKDTIEMISALKHANML